MTQVVGVNLLAMRSLTSKDPTVDATKMPWGEVFPPLAGGQEGAWTMDYGLLSRFAKVLV